MGFVLTACQADGNPADVTEETGSVETSVASGEPPVGSTTDPEPEATSASTDQPETTFIIPPDGVSPGNECSLWDQECPDGEKCMPWANDGGNSWNATKCTPIDSAPAQAGDVCTVEGSGVSGIDDCDEGMMCWDVNPETNEGTCVAMCEGSEQAPVCSDPNTACTIANDGALILCLGTCDPLQQDCPEGKACYGSQNDFVCVPDASGAEEGGYGTPCEFANACDPGFACFDAAFVPDCGGSEGCCTPFCDVSADPATVCSEGAAGGQECLAWYGEDEAPPGYENVGICSLPQQ